MKEKSARHLRFFEVKTRGCSLNPRQMKGVIVGPKKEPGLWPDLQIGFQMVRSISIRKRPQTSSFFFSKKNCRPGTHCRTSKMAFVCFIVGHFRQHVIRLRGFPAGGCAGAWPGWPGWRTVGWLLLVAGDWPLAKNIGKHG